MTHRWTSRRAHVLRTAAACALLAIVVPDRVSSAQTDEIRVGQPASVPLSSGARVEVYGGSGYILLKKALATEVDLIVDAGIAGEFVLQQSAR